VCFYVSHRQLCTICRSCCAVGRSLVRATISRSRNSRPMVLSVHCCAVIRRIVQISVVIPIDSAALSIVSAVLTVVSANPSIPTPHRRMHSYSHAPWKDILLRGINVKSGLARMPRSGTFCYSIACQWYAIWRKNVYYTSTLWTGIAGAVVTG